MRRRSSCWLVLALKICRAARRCASAFSVPVKGTLGLVLLAKQRGIIPSAAAVVQTLINTGFRLDNRLLQEVLERTVGETWPP